MNLNRQTLFSFALLVLVISFTISCMKEPKLSDGDGSPVSVDDMQTKLIEAWGEFEPIKIKANEFNYQEKTVQLSTLFPQLTLQKGITVTQLIDHPTQNELHIVIQANEILDNSQSKPSSRERTVYVNKPPEPSPNPTAMGLHQAVRSSILSASQSAEKTTTTAIHPSADEGEISQLGVELYYNLMNICAPPSQAMIDQGLINIECFNLKVTNDLEAAPEQVQKQPNCQGLTDCKMHTTNLQFDIVYTDYNSSTRVTSKSRVLYRVKFSADAPFFSKLLDFCYTGMAATANQRFPVTICTKTLNFKFGG